MIIEPAIIISIHKTIYKIFSEFTNIKISDFEEPTNDFLQNINKDRYFYRIFC